MDVIKQEVLSKNRRALVLYGDGHLRRYSKWRGTDGPAPPTLLNRIEGEGAKAFAIWTNTTVELERLQEDIGTWPIPSLTIIRGTNKLEISLLEDSCSDASIPRAQAAWGDHPLQAIEGHKMGSGYQLTLFKSACDDNGAAKPASETVIWKN